MTTLFCTRLNCYMFLDVYVSMIKLLLDLTLVIDLYRFINRVDI